MPKQRWVIGSTASANRRPRSSGVRSAPGCHPLTAAVSMLLAKCLGTWVGRWSVRQGPGRLHGRPRPGPGTRFASRTGSNCGETFCRALRARCRQRSRKRADVARLSGHGGARSCVDHPPVRWGACHSPEQLGPSPGAIKHQNGGDLPVRFSRGPRPQCRTARGAVPGPALPPCGEGARQAEAGRLGQSETGQGNGEPPARGQREEPARRRRSGEH